MVMMNRILISLLFIALITISANNNFAENNLLIKNKITNSVDNKKAPDFSLTGTDGKIIKLSDFKGKVIIIDFWATWCPPCRKGIPDLIELQKEFGKKVVVIGISLDQEKSDVPPFMKKMGINYPVAYGTPEVFRLYADEDAIPHSFIIDRKGNLVDQHIGLVDKSEYSELIKKLLKKS
jgi:cytochrome c biogenesis protein CcmG/thiol:disulfide interchange protein DsbE